MSNEQALIIAVPIVLSQIATLVVLVFGFISNNKRLDDVVSRLGRIEERLTTLEVRAWR